MEDFQGKSAVITETASGIGLELAHQFGRAGMNLMLADIEKPALDQAEADLRSEGFEVAGFELDVRDLEQIKALETATRERFGNVHLLCNNAGVGSGGPVADLDNLERWRWTIDIDLWGVIYGCKVFIPAMIEHGEPSHVVNTASMAGLGTVPMMGAYCVAKYGVVALSETLVQEMQMQGTSVGVSVLCPEFVKTGIAQSDRNLPEEFRGAEPDPTPEREGVQSMIEALVDGGIDTSIVGEAVVEAVKANQFWILTHDHVLPGITARANQIVNRVNPKPAFG